MSITEQPHSIHLFNHISQEEFNRINQLMDLCCKHDNINLKLELDYKLHLNSLAEKAGDTPSDSKSEFLYYIGDELVAYLGISCFDGVTAELCGMTHPQHRRQGIFHRLFALALNDCRYSDYKRLLLLADGSSESGMHFLKANTDSYAHSEYRMKRLPEVNPPIGVPAMSSEEAVILRLACKDDEPVIAKMNALFFDEKELDTVTGEYKIKPLEDDPANFKTYMIDLGGTSIGKINVEYNDQYAFLCGFGILPNYRGKGYGRMGLTQILRHLEAQGIKVIELDVVCTNSNALGLYQSCGFIEQSVMNYYVKEFTLSPQP